MGVPPGWTDALARAARARTTVILGGSDGGKTTLTAFLATGLWEQGLPVLVLDADVGQSEIGPPTTLGLGRVTGPIARPAAVPAEALWFVGVTSPIARMGCVAAGAGRLAARAAPADRLVVDTSGLPAGPIGIALKRRKLAALRPDLLIALERRGECEGLLAACAGQAEVLRLPVAGAARVRSARERARFRADAFAAYFADAAVIRVAMDPTAEVDAGALGATPPVDGRVLVGLDDAAGDTRGVGEVLAVAADGRALSIRTPVARERVAGIRVGSGAAAVPVLHEVCA